MGLFFVDLYALYLSEFEMQDTTSVHDEQGEEGMSFLHRFQ